MMNYQEKQKIQTPADKEPVRMGVISERTEDGLYLVQFDGETEASGKPYPALYTGYTPAAGDRVACLRARGSYIILGKYGG